MRFEDYGYDQYDSFLVSADTPEECEEIVKKAHPESTYGEVEWRKGFKVQHIGKTNRKKEILLGSYNTG